jgi:hypothetical protein
MAGPITGNPYPQLQPNQFGKNETGNYTIVSYECADKQSAFALVSVLGIEAGINYEVTESFGKSRLTVHYPYSLFGINPATDAVEMWEFFAQHAEKDILEATVESGIISTLSINNVIQIRLFLQSPTLDDNGLPNITVDSFSNDGNQANALAVYQIMMAGVRSYPVEQPVLRYSITTSNRYAIRRSLWNVRKILSTSTLVALNNIPNALLFNLPYDYSQNSAFAYGWYQMFPNVQQIALLKWQIVQEWQYGLWSTLIWGNPI